MAIFLGQRGQWELLEEFIITNSNVVRVPIDVKTGRINLGRKTVYR